MSKFDLRDISQRLAASRDTEAVVFEFLGYLQASRSDWRASISFYEVSQDALINVYTRQGERLVRKDVIVAADQLPPRLVRKFFHPSAFFNATDRRSLLSNLFQASPVYEPDPLEAPALQQLTPISGWQSCVCLPLADQEDLIAMLMIVSEKRGAFPSRVVGEIIPLKSMAALALAQQLYRAARRHNGDGEERVPRAVAAEFQDRIRRLNQQTETLTQENQAKAAQLQALGKEIEQLDKSSSQYREELDRVKGQLFALEQQSATATQHLTDTYTQLTEEQFRVGQLQRTVGFLKDVFQVLAQEHDGDTFARTMVAWFCEHFGVDRCSLMLLDEANETLIIAAYQGMDAEVAARAKVRLGQGIAGWVAHTRKPLLVRMEGQGEVALTHQDAYNSDSFVSVPLVHGNRVSGVLNLSNKRGGEPFDELDLDRATLAGSVLAMTLSGQELVRRAGAWS
jgi:putative methionine-R-sulfoxide reductase with GAF domain